MATGGVDSENVKIEDPVKRQTCAICLERYRRPKLLPCFHTFCQSCLQSVASSARPSFLCPACRTPVLLPSGGVGALPTNFYIEKNLGTSSSSPPPRQRHVCIEDREATHKETPCFTCRHDNTAANPAMTGAFAGIDNIAQPMADLPDAAAISQSHEQPDNSSSKLPPKEIVYSEDQSCFLYGICPTRQNQLWVVYSPHNYASTHIKLLDEQGGCVTEITHVNHYQKRIYNFRVMVALDNMLLCHVYRKIGWILKWVKPDGTHGRLAKDLKALLTSSASGYSYSCMPPRSDEAFYRISVTSVRPWLVTKQVVFKEPPCDGSVRDVSAQEKYFAFVDDGAAKVFERRGPGDFRLSCSYTPRKEPTDLRFYRTDGREMILVAVPEEGKVHMVDHTDGTFVGYLETSPRTLHKPYRLATDYMGTIWIGCDGGKVVVVNL